MPLLAGHRASPPVSPRPPRPSIGKPVLTWIAPDGGVWPMSDRRLPWWTLPGWSHVVGAAPLELSTDDRPRGGARVRHVQPLPRVMVWPLRVGARTHMEFVQAVRALAGAFTQTRRLGPGRMRIARPDGTAREIEAYYEGGFSGEPGQTVLRDEFALSLFCEDPYWRDVEPTVVARMFSEPADYYDPYTSISSGQVLGETTIANDGDVEAWPTWTVVGPMAELTAANHTTGESFTLSAQLEAGETARITTDPGSVRGPNGQNWSGLLDWPGAVLWGLTPGRNDVEFVVSGAADGTCIEIAYRRRHETP